MTRPTEPCSAPGCDRAALDDSAWCVRHAQEEQQRRARDEGLHAADMSRPIRDAASLYEPTPRPLEEAKTLSAAARAVIEEARLRKAQVPDPAREAS